MILQPLVLKIHRRKLFSRGHFFRCCWALTRLLDFLLALSVNRRLIESLCTELGSSRGRCCGRRGVAMGGVGAQQHPTTVPWDLKLHTLGASSWGQLCCSGSSSWPASPHPTFGLESLSMSIPQRLTSLWISILHLDEHHSGISIPPCPPHCFSILLLDEHPTL